MKRYRPLILTLIIIALDQVSKAIIVHTIAEGTVGLRLFSDFLWICHVRNDAVAFSLGSSFPLWLKYIVFVLFPLVILIVLAISVVSKRFEKETTYFQKWCIAGIIGGGIGNMIDRLFRSLRVVDWISTNNYGFLGMERFPTYNIADAAVVLSVIALVLSLLIERRSKSVKEN